MNPIFIICFMLIHCILLPVNSLIYIIHPKCKIGKLMSLPCVKFISHFASYLSFIGMLIASSLRFAKEEKQLERFSHKYSNYFSNYTEYVENIDYVHQVDFSDFYIRSYKPSDLDLLITIWVIGQTWHEIKKLFQLGIYEYLYSPINIVNSLLNVLYIISYGLKYHTMILVASKLKQIETSKFWLDLGNLNETDLESQKNIYETFYWLNSDRFYWKSFDPINLSEGFFAIGNVIAFARLCYFLPISQQLGPLEITLGKMINDIFKFICIFIIVFTSFLFSLNNLYLYYNTEIRKKVEVSAPYNHEEEAENPFLTKAELGFGS
ncbi:short transient receptor potential channel 3-like [Brachionus plicatilis]|uniref:Short transient receptor potential channel 3-like n=1 Tax=Brachionus plicatilis TaxID=10195 RepID=A0A3M7P3K4_BRAPC|nr:short transient receptor potential channel 3-like [Brachionus plicatilis]